MENNPVITGSATPNPSSKNKYINLDAYTSQCNIALTNASGDEIAPLLAARGYTAPIIAAKQNELNNVLALIANQKKEYGEQYQATQNYNQTAANLHTKYSEHVAIARIVFKNDLVAQTSLDIKGKRKRSASGYCNQAILFYQAALDNASYTTALNAKGVTTAELNEGKTGYKNLLDLEAKQAKETGEAQGATALRDKAIDDFAEWFSEFKTISKIALNSQPQLRETMGWKE